MPVEFNRERFKDAVLYIAWKTKDDPAFGRTKFAKALFYADMETYADNGKALTGARYEHWKFGPFPPVLYPVEKGLAASGKAVVRQSEGRQEEKLVPLGEVEPGWERLEDLHRWMLDAWVAKMEAVPAGVISDRSHEHPGWELTEEREMIPYHVGAISRRKPTAEDFQRADEIAVGLGWK